MHPENKIEIVYADKGYAEAPNCEFLLMNNIQDASCEKIT